MTDASEEIVTFRLAPRDKSAIQRLVDRGEFTTRSDFLRYAIKSTLERYEGAASSADKLDLDLEGVDLPQHASAARRGRASAGRTRRGN